MAKPSSDFLQLASEAKDGQLNGREGRMFFFEKKTKKLFPGASHEAEASSATSSAAGIQTLECLRRSEGATGVGPRSNG
jgi:hypothetical protein